jgi:hypothetical protein
MVYKPSPGRSRFIGLEFRISGSLVWPDDWDSLDTDLKPVPLLLSVEGHYWPVVWYRGQGAWNLRGDFEQTPSFIHEDQNGHGGDVSTTLQYSITKSWLMTAGWTGRFLRTSNGMDRTFFSDGTQGSIPLLRVSQDTHWFHIGLGYVW